MSSAGTAQMPARQLTHLTIDQLEQLFDEKRSNGDVLTTLLGELSHRDTSRSRGLKRRVVGALAMAKPQQPIEASPFRMTPEQHRGVAEDLRQGEPVWSDEQRAEASRMAEQHDMVAKAIERRNKKT